MASLDQHELMKKFKTHDETDGHLTQIEYVYSMPLPIHNDESAVASYK